MKATKFGKREFDRLRDAWASTHPRRASGGLVALQGFQLQIHSALRDAVRAWIQDKASPGVVMEGLSDIAGCESDGRWRITQVKRSGTSSSLRKALEEFWTIHEIALQETPTLVDDLHYEVRCGRWELKDAQAVIDGWRPAPGVEDCAIERFLTRIALRTDPHPRHELVELLVKETAALDPLAFVERWTGRLLRDGTAAAEDLFSELVALDRAKNRLPGGIRLVSSNLAEPEKVELGGYLVGQQPRLRHLREGFFAPRPWQLDPAVQQILRWIDSSPFANDREGRLPAFWIAGRSGSGKSVLLLQAMARLVAAGIGPLLWIGNRHHRLPAALRWAVRACWAGEQPIVCIDDPFASGELGSALGHWREALDEIEELRDSGEQVPLVLTCGPSEQLESARRELGSDVTFAAWVLEDDLDNAHIGELSDWFEARTGARPPEVGSGDVLMVQRFFEWRTGEALEAFAQRFRGRIEALNPSGQLVKFVECLLAVNRLYAGLPRAAVKVLEPHDRDALEILRRDHHLTIEAGEDSGRPGLWLGHPHLSDALFNGWLPSERVYERAGALQQAITLSRTTGESPGEQTAPLWALWRAKTGGLEGRIAERVDWPSTEAVLRVVWGVESVPLSHIPVWIHLAAEVITHALNPEPVDIALGKLRVESLDATGSRLTCHILLHHLDEFAPSRRDLVLGKLRMLLDRATSWREWPWVALDLVSKSGEVADGQRILDWCWQHTNNRMVPKLLLRVMQLPSLLEETIKLATDHAAHVGAERHWARVYEALLRCDLSPEHVEHVVAWVRRHQEDTSVPFVVAELLRREHVAAEALARTWLEATGNTPVTNFLLERLLASYPEDAALLEKALLWVGPELGGSDRLIEHLIDQRPHDVILVATQWLAVNEVHVGWAHVFQKLVDAVGDDEERLKLIDTGIAWLSGREDSPQWAFVLQKLLDVVQDEGRRTALIQTAMAWLPGREGQQEWSFVLQKLLDVVEDDNRKATLMQRAMAWLLGRGDQREWYFVFKKLLGVVENDDQRTALIDAGMAWLVGREDSPHWSLVLQKLLSVVEDDNRRAALVQTGTAWMVGRGDQQGWNFVLQKLLDVVEQQDQRAALIDAGLAWLAGHEDSQQWAFVLRKLLDVVDDRKLTAALVDVGIAWLPGRGDRQEWNFVLQKLLDVATEVNQRNLLVAAGMAWLVGREDRQQWAFVLQKLVDVMEDDPQRASLIDAGMAWLTGREDQPQWSFVLQKLLEVVVDDKQKGLLIDTGLAWLARRGHEDQSPFVLQKLLDAVVDEGRWCDLLEIAFEWLNGKKPSPIWGQIRRSALARTSRVSAPVQLRIICLMDDLRARESSKYLFERLQADQVDRASLLRELLTAWDTTLPGWQAVAQQLTDTATDPDERGVLAAILAECHASCAPGSKRTMLGTLLARVGGDSAAAGSSGDVLHGVVTDVQSYGVFVRSDVGIVLLPISRIPARLLPAFMETVRTGQIQPVRLDAWDRSKRSWNVSHPDFVLPPEGGPVRIDEIEARVMWIVNYGVFLDVGGYAGLLHKSKISDPTILQEWRPNEMRAVRVLAWDPTLSRWNLASFCYDPSVAS